MSKVKIRLWNRSRVTSFTRGGKLQGGGANTHSKIVGDKPTRRRG